MLHSYWLAKSRSNPDIVTLDLVLLAIILSWFTICQQKGCAEGVEVIVQEIEKTSEWTQLRIVSQLPHSGFLKSRDQCTSPEWEDCCVRKVQNCSFCLYTTITALQSFCTNIFETCCCIPVAFFQILFLAITRIGYCWQHVYSASFVLSSLSLN